MMPPTATLEDIKAHQLKVEKDKITPDRLPPCPRCSVESDSFKIHAYRERRFLIIIERLIKAAFCTLVRFKCPGCGKTFTDYPDFAIPRKHYTRQSFMGFSANYLEPEDTTYQQAVMVDNSAPGYPQNDATLAPSTVHRWITTLSRLTQTCRSALILVLQETTQDSALVLVDKLAAQIERLNASADNRISARFGVTQCQKNDNAVSMLERAESALAEARSNESGISIAI